MSLTPKIGLTKPDHNATNWDTPLNANYDILDNALGVVQFASLRSGANAGEKILAALTAIPSTGGIVDARGFEGAQTITSNIFSGVTKPFWLLLGGATFTTNVQLVLEADGQQIIGIGPSASEIKASATNFPINTPVIRLGNGTGTLHRTRVENLSINCNDVSGCIGLYSNNLDEQSGVYRVLVRHFGGKGIHLTGSAARNVALKTIELNSSSGATGAIGVHLENVGERVSVEDITVGNDAAVTQAAGIKVTGGNATIRDAHFESQTDGILFDATALGCSAINISGHSSVTNLIHIASGTSRIHLAALTKKGGTNLVVDDVFNKTFTNTAMTLYIHGAGSNDPIFFEDTDTFVFGSPSAAQIPLGVYRNTSTNGSGVRMLWKANDSAGNIETYGAIGGVINSNTNGAETGSLQFLTIDAGTLANRMTISNAGAVTPAATGQTLGDNTHQWRTYNQVVATGSLPAAAASMDGVVLIEDVGTGDRNLIVYAGGQRFRIDGGAAF